MTGYEALSQDEAERLYETHGFLLLEGLPPRTQISIDGHSEVYITNDQFKGIKFVPQGWHCISWSVPISSEPQDEQSGNREALDSVASSSRVFGQEGVIKNLLWHYFGEGEIAIRQLDRRDQQLVVPDSSSSSRGSRSRKILRVLEPQPGKIPHGEAATTIVSRDLLKSLDSQLLPYPREAWRKWHRATSYLSSGEGEGNVGKRVLARVLGCYEESGDSSTDTLATGPSSTDSGESEQNTLSQGNLGREEKGKRIWGKSRPEIEDTNTEEFEVPIDEEELALEEARDAEGQGARRKRKREGVSNAEATLSGYHNFTDSNEQDDGDDDGTVRFTTFDLRRSWPPNAVGADLTRWSQDKSCLLRTVMAKSCSSSSTSRRGAGDLQDTQMAVLENQDRDTRVDPVDASYFLAEYQLAFLLFLMSGNAYCWNQWKKMLTLFCRSPAYMGAGSGWDLHPSMSIPTSESSDTATRHGLGTAQAELGLHTSFLEVLESQLDLLNQDFWSIQSSVKEEEFVIAELNSLRANIGRALAARASALHHAQQQQQQQKRSSSQDQALQAQKLVQAWRKLSYETQQRFGWQLDKDLDEEVEVQQDLEAESGEDAPVVVEL